MYRWLRTATRLLLATPDTITQTATGTEDAKSTDLTNGFQPTGENNAAAPGPAPDGMVWIPGGEFSMGAQDAPDQGDVGMQATLDSRPIHRVYVDGFWMDKTDVTNGKFAEFVRGTGYVTVAERKTGLD